MRKSVQQLISLGKIIAKPAQSLVNNEQEVLPKELYRFLSCANGLFAFESALMIRPLVCENDIQSVFEWNERDLWKSKYYNDQILNTLFFAEDAFGCQFGYFENQIYFFDSETGELDFLCKTFNEWSELIVSECRQYTGYQLMHEWQVKNGSIAQGNRLCPKLPFVLGGQYEIDNLYSIPALEGMLLRTNIAVQIRDLPDGSEIQLKIE